MFTVSSLPWCNHCMLMVLYINVCNVVCSTYLTRLNYFIYGGALNDSSSFYVLNKAAAKASSPSSETVLPYLQDSSISSKYTLLPTGNGTLYAAKYAFSLLSMEEVLDKTTFNTIQTQLQGIVNTGELLSVYLVLCWGLLIQVSYSVFP